MPTPLPAAHGGDACAHPPGGPSTSQPDRSKNNDPQTPTPILVQFSALASADVCLTRAWSSKDVFQTRSKEMKTKLWTIGAAALGLTTLMAVAKGPNRGGPGSGNGGSTSDQLSPDEAGYVLSIREEEKLARDVYLAMYDVWGIDIFANISEAEQRHMDAILGVIDRYDLQDPVVDDSPGAFSEPAFAELYDQLVAAGNESFVEALKVGALIEEMDIVDLRIALSATDNPDVQQVYENLMRASRNHLRSFAKLIAAAGETYEAQYLTQEEFDEIANSPMETGGK
jgi:hypothetical protein